MNNDYIKDYKEKELKQYVLVYFLITVSVITIYLQCTYSGDIDTLTLVMEMLGLDVLIGAVSILVCIFNEIWSDSIKNRIVYKKGKLPSSDIFSRIGKDMLNTEEFDINIAKEKYKGFSDKDSSAQSHKWNELLNSSRENEKGNVIEAQRMQLLTRDLCLTNVSLFIMTIIVCVVVTYVTKNFADVLNMMSMPALYLIFMYFITRCAARQRAERFAVLVIKNDCLD